MTALSRTATALLFGLAFLAWTAPAQAQPARALDIHDGTVYIDGTAVPADQIPDSLDLEGIEARYRFVGIQMPVVELNGQLYAVDDGLKPVSEDEVRQRNASVILRSMQSSRQQAVQAARSRRAPDLQAARQQYLSEVQQQSRSLYERLVRENRMEAETHELARVIRLLPEGEARQAQVDSLRSTLNEIFDLKQENRRREIEQLQQQIMELQRSLQQREQMREAMIERRMQQLLGTLEQE